jgi:hypothetical protein
MLLISVVKIVLQHIPQQTGQHPLMVSFSAYDPEQTWSWRLQRFPLFLLTGARRAGRPQTGKSAEGQIEIAPIGHPIGR